VCPFAFTFGHWVWVFLPRCSLRCTPPLGWRRTLCCFLARYLVVKEPKLLPETQLKPPAANGHRRIGLFPQGAVVTPVLAHSVASSAATRHRAKRQRTGDYSRSVRLGQRIDKPDEAPLPYLNHCVNQDIPGDALVLYPGPVDADRPLFQ